MSFPLVFGSSSDNAGVTLSDYWQRLAKTLGYFAVGTVTTEASGIEAERYIISSTLASDSAPPGQYDDLFVYIINGDQAGAQRRLVNGSYEGSIAALAADYPFAAPLAVGTSFAITVLPVQRCRGIGGLVETINWALDQLPIRRLVEVTSDETRRVSLVGYTWPVRGVYALYGPRTDDDDPYRSVPGFTVNLTAEDPYVQLPYTFASGDTITLDLLSSASTRIMQNGVWADSAVGLVDDTDAALYSAATVVRAARPEALRRMMQMHPRGSPTRLDIEREHDRAQVTQGISRFYNSYRRNAVQRVGAI